MTTASASLLEPALERQTDISVVVDCTNGVERPRWGLMAESHHAELTTELQDVLSVGPMFHVKDDGSASGQPLHVSIKLDGAIFDAQQFAREDPMLHSTSESPGQVTVSPLGANRALVTWKGSTTAGWDRWIVRLRIRDEDSSRQLNSIYLGFTCLRKDERSALRAQLLSAASSLRATSAEPLTLSGDALKLRVRIDVEGEEPRFPELFKPRQEIGLPDNVFLEPLIVVNRAGGDKILDFEFASDDAIFIPTGRSDCNRGIEGKEPLALAWMGLTNPKKCEGPEESVSRGFVTSWIDPEEKLATVRWREQESDAERQRAASFFFVRRVAAESDPSISGILPLGALVDPTIVYDKDEPPGG